MSKPPTYHPKLSNEEVRTLEHERTRPKCLHVWNHLPSMTICRICLDAHIEAARLKNQQYALTRAFHRALNPIISRAEIKRLEAERNKIVIAFKLKGKRGKNYEIHLTPNTADIGGVFVELFEGNHIGGRKSLAGAHVSTAEFAAVGALITNPEIIPKNPNLAPGEVDLKELYGDNFYEVLPNEEEFAVVKKLREKHAGTLGYNAAIDVCLQMVKNYALYNEDNPTGPIGQVPSDYLPPGKEWRAALANAIAQLKRPLA